MSSNLLARFILTPQISLVVFSIIGMVWIYLKISLLAISRLAINNIFLLMFTLNYNTSIPILSSQIYFLM